MAEDIEIPVVHGAQDAFGLRLPVKSEPRMDRANRVIQFREQRVRIIQRAVGENIHFRRLQDADAVAFFVECIDIERIIENARRNGCFFEINSSPDRLDLSAENARRAAAAGVMIAVSTDSHSTREFDLIRCGLEQARRAGLARDSILNCQPWKSLSRLFVR